VWLQRSWRGRKKALAPWKMTRTPAEIRRRTDTKKPPASARAHLFAALHLDLLAVVRTERGVLQESSSILYRMPPSIRERVTSLANLVRRMFSRPAFAHQPVWCWVLGGRVASNWQVTEAGVCQPIGRSDSRLDLRFNSAVLSRLAESARYDFTRLRTAVILCSSPGSRVTDAARILLASTQRN